MRVIAEAAAIAAEETKRKAIEVPAVGGIAVRTEVRVMRGHDDGAAAGHEQTVKFFDGSDDVSDMFDDMDGADLAEGAIGQRPGEVIEICNKVSTRARIAIDADSAGILVDAAANIENGKGLKGGRGGLDAAIVAGSRTR